MLVKFPSDIRLDTTLNPFHSEVTETGEPIQLQLVGEELSSGVKIITTSVVSCKVVGSNTDLEKMQKYTVEVGEERKPNI